MKFTLLMMVFLVAFSTAKADELPAYPKKLKGTLLLDLQRRFAMEFNGGDTANCTRKEAPSLIVYRCDNKGGALDVTDERGSLSRYEFTQVTLFLKTSQAKGLLREYFFYGKHAETKPVAFSTPTTLHLYHYRDAPNNIQGELTLDNYSLSTPIQASPY